MARKSKKRKVVPNHVFIKIEGHKLTPICIGCGKRFITRHSAKKYCDNCLKRKRKK
ncbi:MAG: hypothetical protein ABH879_08000 [archaeon]